MRPGTRQLVITASFLLLLGSLARGQFVSGSDGSDGDFNPTQNIQVDLTLAAAGTWDTPSPVAGNGVYDPVEWAVVFKYATINVPAGVTVTFKNHASAAPVVWLATGNVTIDGTVKLDGSNGASYASTAGYASGGPGGFPGGVRKVNALLGPSDGFGPGGGTRAAIPGGGGYGTAGVAGAFSPFCSNPGTGTGGTTYGNASILPLIGGSGGGGSSWAGYDPEGCQSADCCSNPGGGGGGAGGAILIASSGNITLGATGSMTAKGGNGGTDAGAAGSGGGIRLIANTISGDGQLRALGGSGDSFEVCYYTAACRSTEAGDGGKGRIRVEAEIQVRLSDAGDPNWTTSTPGPVFPPDHAPRLYVTAVDGVAAPDDPIAGILTTDIDINNAQAATVQIEALNIPPGSTVKVIVKPARGAKIEVNSAPLEGSFALSTATAQVTFPAGRSEIQLKANWTP